MDTQRWPSPEKPPPLAVLAASTRGIFRTGIGSDKKLAWASPLVFPLKKLRRLMFSTGSYPSVCNHCVVPRCTPSRLGLRCCSYAGLLARMMLASLGFLSWVFLSFCFATNSRLSALLDLLRSSGCSICGWIFCGSWFWLPTTYDCRSHFRPAACYSGFSWMILSGLERDSCSLFSFSSFAWLFGTSSELTRLC
jgi:hypothetical protein